MGFLSQGTEPFPVLGQLHWGQFEEGTGEQAWWVRHRGGLWVSVGESADPTGRSPFLG